MLMVLVVMLGTLCIWLYVQGVEKLHLICGAVNINLNPTNTCLIPKATTYSTNTESEQAMKTFRFPVSSPSFKSTLHVRKGLPGLFCRTGVLLTRLYPWHSIHLAYTVAFVCLQPSGNCSPSLKCCQGWLEDQWLDQQANAHWVKFL